MKSVFVILACFQAAFGVDVLFAPGKEYVYNYVTLVTTGTESPAGYASAYKIDGSLRVQAETSNLLNVKLEDLSVGLYNGPWTYFPLPAFSNISTVDFSTLTDPFQINTENGKFKSLVINDQEQEWAANLKRGIANYLQIDFGSVQLDQVQIVPVSEMTVMGECRTKYEVLPASATKVGVAQVSKFRNHADCPDIPTRKFQAAQSFYKCQDETLQNVFNSTSYATYDLDDSVAGEVKLNQLVVYTSALYWPFTATSPYMYTWANFNLFLREVLPITNILPPPENKETHEDLSFIFDQNDLNDPEEDAQLDLKAAEPLMFHHAAGESDPDVLQNIVDQVKEAIEEAAADSLYSPKADGSDGTSDSILHLVDLISVLDYDSLTKCQAEYAEAVRELENESNQVEYKLFLDAVIMAGTSPGMLLIRDILNANTDKAAISHVVATFPLYVRNPTEALASEFSTVFEKLSNPKVYATHRTLELSLATLISKACRKTNCSTSGILDQYINYFESKLQIDDFEVQTAGMLGLRNIGIGRAITILSEVATGARGVDKSARIHAIWSLRPLCFQGDDAHFKTLLPVFYNRSESCETRASVFGLLMTCKPDERILHEIAYFMWSEGCPQTSNYVRTALMNMANSQYPCSKTSKAAARTILEYLPPGAVDPVRSSTHSVHYYNQEYGLGQGITTSMMRTGKSTLPVSVYVGFDVVIGGYASHYMGLYIRAEGLGKELYAELSALALVSDISEIQNVLNTIGVKLRPNPAFKLELSLMYKQRAISYVGFDLKKLTELGPGPGPIISALQKSFSNLMVTATRYVSKTVLYERALYQQPMEIGVPISIWSAAGSHLRVKSSIEKSSSSSIFGISREGELQFQVFGRTQITNHFVGLGTSFSVAAERKSEARVSVKNAIQLDVSNRSLKIQLKPASESNPNIIISHTATKTKVGQDALSSSGPKFVNLLPRSCPNCKAEVIASKGPNSSKNGTWTLKSSLVSGTKLQLGYTNCERKITRGTVLRDLRKRLSSEDKNTGLYGNSFTKIALGVQEFLDVALISPYSEKCALSASFSGDSSSGPSLQEVAIVLTGNVEPGNKINAVAKIQYKYGSGNPDHVVEMYADVKEKDLNTQNIRFKLVSKKANSSKILCYNSTVEQSLFPNDILSYEDESEPVIRQRSQLLIGNVAPDDLQGKRTTCTSDRVRLDYNVEAKRSDEQVFQSQQDTGPYKACNAQSQSEIYPGEYIPPTLACTEATVEQTTLRDVHINVSYDLGKGIFKRVSGPLNILRGLFHSYLEDKSSSEEQEASAPPAGYEVSGNTVLKFNFSAESPKLDVEYQQTGNVLEKYHGIDLSTFPSLLVPDAIASRFSDIERLGFRLGYYGTCAVHPSIVHTLDGLTVTAELPECYTLISADCGPRPQYAILAKRASDSSIDVKVMALGSTLEIEAGEVTADGLELSHRTAVKYPADSPVFTIIKNGDEIHVYSSYTDLYVRYTGGFVTVKLGSRYRGTHCGICGHWDSTAHNDALGPDPECQTTLGAQDFFKSYVYRHGDCDAVGSACPP